MQFDWKSVQSWIQHRKNTELYMFNGKFLFYQYLSTLKFNSQNKEKMQNCTASDRRSRIHRFLCLMEKFYILSISKCTQAKY
jgi:hypothetical protein